ncbi:hypothetical protein [Bacillus mycoides]|uniref:hypothetical protein n=1 Tax=Bacillus mycoides TaxID=1405 RepID=UPI0001A04696|nr:hypothetical protein [Bacillus mycoides]EEL06747.1 hypothetical protein bcere0014_16780 [Bacillus cereus BDRD-ST196]AIW85769.1 hypothetical protein bwei_3150 [Bacillus mycoides]MCQ6529012.1 hypothetical protein [Bacillus mycoides]TKI42073.1 hypothetical protein FC700_18565 [Bacillus mycoides]GAE38974.1 hypothetical protein BW1_014_00140 [Bacillus mycoides NBRC 101238 = DSM 11821]
MEAIQTIEEKDVTTAIFQFIFPFSFKTGYEQNMFPFLQKNDFRPFRLDHLEDENTYYGKFQVSHQNMEAYYLSFTNKILFPHSEHQKGLQRYSKDLNLNGHLTTNLISVPFKIHSIDVTLCPYELGFLTIRTEIKTAPNMTLSEAIEFAARFRVLETKSDTTETICIECDGKKYSQVEKLIFGDLFHGLTDFFENKRLRSSYFQTFPFFEDQRMYVQTLLSINKESDLHIIDVYRTSSLSGLSDDGKPYISANNVPYIHDYLTKHSYQRWAPNRYFIMEEHIFTCITNEGEQAVTKLASQMYGEFYYALLLNLFHKVVLLKMANAYAELNIEQDTNEIEKLIYSINSFTANYFSLELVSQSQSEDIFFRLRKLFNIEVLYTNAKQNLDSLFKYQENVASKKDSLLLLILTLYSVVGQMLGFTMIDLLRNTDSNKISSPFEFFALLIAISGIVISLILGAQGLYQWAIQHKRRKAWVKQTVLSAVKEKKDTK